MNAPALTTLFLLPLAVGCQGAKELELVRDSYRADLQGLDLAVARAEVAKAAAADQFAISANHADLATAENAQAKLIIAEDEYNKLLQEQEETEESLKRLYGVNWGASIGLLTGGEQEISEASIDPSGNVSVDKSTKSRAVALLEVHKFLYGNGVKKDASGKWKANHIQWGVGPFLAVGVASTDKVVDGFGGGVMFGARTSDVNTSFNLGIGGYWVGEVQTLANDFTEGAPPPGAETQVRYKKEDDWKLLVMFSFAWSV